ncbi:MAG: hypothetical protein KC492_44540 [Myxococcales bacterium]|nr:hypothetical protein [Myxococcales bacterium]
MSTPRPNNPIWCVVLATLAFLMASVTLSIVAPCPSPVPPSPAVKEPPTAPPVPLSRREVLKRAGRHYVR